MWRSPGTHITIFSPQTPNMQKARRHSKQTSTHRLLLVPSQQGFVRPTSTACGGACPLRRISSSTELVSAAIRKPWEPSIGCRVGMKVQVSHGIPSDWNAFPFLLSWCVAPRFRASRRGAKRIKNQPTRFTADMPCLLHTAACHITWRMTSPRPAQPN